MWFVIARTLGTGDVDNTGGQCISLVDNAGDLGTGAVDNVDYQCTDTPNVLCLGLEALFVKGQRLPEASVIWGRVRTNVWKDPGVGTGLPERDWGWRKAREVVIAGEQRCHQFGGHKATGSG
ncbi:hypothetical protein AMTR_s00020p00052850 [Amborella trichopoda]|uniref:Uncharacterized protein n=1 Tax=Amborella trichopoda TaxID=13333 RepID=W1PWT1_AMBTC|nr:hypothetical protein AMTR_s00020p00052850 [Amborella trichopoda]